MKFTFEFYVYKINSESEKNLLTVRRETVSDEEIFEKIIRPEQESEDIQVELGEVIQVTL